MSILINHKKILILEDSLLSCFSALKLGQPPGNKIL